MTAAAARGRPVEPLRWSLPARFRALAPPAAMRGSGGCFQEQFRSKEEPDAKLPHPFGAETRPLSGTHRQDHRRARGGTRRGADRGTRRVRGSTTPVNAATGHRYRGVNLFVLGMSPLAFTTGDPRWCSYRQAVARGWQVRRGEKATPVYFYKPIEIADKMSDRWPETRRIPMLRTFSVFHASQIDGVPALAPSARRRPSSSASRTWSSFLRRAACRFGSAVSAPFTIGRVTSSNCRRTRLSRVRYGEPSSSCTSFPTRAVIRRDLIGICAAALDLFATRAKSFGRS